MADSPAPTLQSRCPPGWTITEIDGANLKARNSDTGETFDGSRQEFVWQFVRPYQAAL